MRIALQVSMAVLVQEIMNHELFSMRVAEPVRDALSYLVALGISGSPVVDETGRPVGMVSVRGLLRAEQGDTIEQHMSRPVVTIRDRSTIHEAARLIGETGYHRLVVVDDEGHAVGIVSSLDVVRGLIGLPASHPPVFPHYDDDTALTWTDDTVLAFDRVEAAPDGPGVMVLVHGGVGQPERVVWAESTSNVRQRLIDILSAPGTRIPGLQQWLLRGELRFRAAAQDDGVLRDQVVRMVWARQAAGNRPTVKN
jgi:CBS domain-containing protein